VLAERSSFDVVAKGTDGRVSRRKLGVTAISDRSIRCMRQQGRFTDRRKPPQIGEITIIKAMLYVGTPLAE